jgi:ATP-dependent Clp protease ATP-binding subunit ClpC
MFERFTESARRVLFFARYAVTELGGVSIGAEHILIGILRTPDPLVTRLFTSLDVSPDALRTEIEQQQKSVAAKVSTSVEIPFDRSAKTLLETAAREADALHHSHIGTEHLLLAVLREEGPAAAVLMKHGMRLNEMRMDVIRLVAELAPKDVTMNRAAMLAHVERIQRITDEVGRLAVEKGVSAELVKALVEELKGLRKRFGP